MPPTMRGRRAPLRSPRGVIAVGFGAAIAAGAGVLEAPRATVRGRVTQARSMPGPGPGRRPPNRARGRPTLREDGIEYLLAAVVLGGLGGL